MTSSLSSKTLISNNILYKKQSGLFQKMADLRNGQEICQRDTEKQLNAPNGHSPNNLSKKTEVVLDYDPDYTLNIHESILV